MSLTIKDLEEVATAKADQLKKFFAAEPPKDKGEDLVALWHEIYDAAVQSTIVQTSRGPSDDEANPVFPYEKLWALVGDGGSWKWPRIWRRFQELERRGPAHRPGDSVHFGLPNPNPHIVPQSVLVVGGGPVGLRLAIQLRLGGHKVTVFEKRREARSEDGELQQLGFTNRINRPHVFTFLRNDLDRLNGKDFMSSKMCYPVFTQADTSSIGIDELQLLLLKNAFLLGVDFRLGASYEDATMVLDPKTQKPRWQVQCRYDEQAATMYNVAPGRNTEVYDVLMGCDGARSRVRESQPQVFGEVDKRNFKKMIGVVANVQKVSRARLRELGWASGLEPTDMKRAHMSGGGMAGLNYYKASYHNYVIFTPSKEDLVRAGFSGSIYSFHQGRTAANPAKEEEKKNLRKWVIERCQEVGIPVDRQLSNDGFVEAPNDVMAFDFSEIWKCKKNFAVSLPPADYDTEADGEWTGTRLIAPIGLVGDAVTEPFWIAGVGLQRGWNGIMDACYIIDNLYNTTFSGCCALQATPPTTWADHMQRLQDILPKLYDCSHDGLMTKEGLQGEFSDQGVVMTQIRRKNPDHEKPVWQLDVEPFARYEQFAKLIEHRYKGAKALENTHPVVQRTFAIYQHFGNDGVATSRPLVSFCGKSPPGGKDKGGAPATKEVANKTPVVASQPSALSAEALVVPKPIPEQELIKVASTKAENLQSMLAKQIDIHVKQTSAATTQRHPFEDDLWKELPQSSGFAEMVETQWDVMTETHLSPAQKAELLHIRNMMTSLKQQISSLNNSLHAYERAEKELLVGAVPKA